MAYSLLLDENIEKVIAYTEQNIIFNLYIILCCNNISKILQSRGNWRLRGQCIQCKILPWMLYTYIEGN